MNKSIKKLIVPAMFLVYILLVYAATFDFDPNIDASTFNLTEDVNFMYDLNVTVNESLVFYSSNAQDLGFSSFILDNTTGIINFTPPNSEVGYYSVTLIAENRSNNFDKVTITVAFNVTNANDAPNITQFGPSQLNFTTVENQSTEFSYNATDIDANDVLNATWYLNDSIVSTNDTFNYTPDFCDAGFRQLLLVVNDTGNENATVLWNITINDSNRAPTLNTTFVNITWDEGTNLTNNLTLSLFFSDEDTLECSGDQQDNLTYSANGNSSIIVDINQTSTNVTFRVPEHFFGVENITFNVTDNVSFVISNNIFLNVTNINDAPEFNVTNQTPIQNVNFLYDVNASDKDNEVQAGINNITYYDNISFTNINETTGLINFTPTASEIGFHVINITVNDTITITSKILTFNISANAVPRINPIENKNATEGILFIMNVSSVDNDNDTLTYSTNFTPFSIITINDSDANFTFTPTNDDVGNYSIKVTVTDAKGAQNTTTFNLSVLNTNNPPNLTAIPDQTIRTDKSFSLTITADDLDNDNLTFTENSSLFSLTYLNISAQTLTFTPTAGDGGNHTFNFTVQDDEAQDSQAVLFTINVNTPPVIFPIGNQTIPEDFYLEVQINASDDDFDTLEFYMNSSFLNLTTINATTAKFNFTPTQNETGIHWINITVNDTPLTASRLFFINVTFVNDTPYFEPPLTDFNVTESLRFFYDVNASDEEGDVLNISTNATIFNISSDGIINFTPTLAQIGNYSVNISVSDGQNDNTTVVNFQVLSFNNAPNITNSTPNGTINLTEKTVQLFNVTVVDPENDTLTFNWYLNTTLVDTAQAFRYQPGFEDDGYYNVTVIVSDGQNEVRNGWNVTVLDTNRAPIFGLINRTSQSDFGGGNISNVNITGESGNITLARNDSINYFIQGNFTSTSLDVLSDTNLTLASISWKEVRPENTSITFFIRTSENNNTFTNFTGNSTANYTSPAGTVINATDNRYVQYKAVLETNNTNTTPTIEHVMVHYEVSDFEGSEDTVYLNYLDLDDFFSDPDGNTLTYNVSDVPNIDITIDSQGRVSLTPDSNFNGVRTAVFTANDGNATVSSNNFTITLIDVSEPSSGSSSSSSSSSSSGGGGGGGGGSSTRIVLINQTVLVNQTVSIEIVAPGKIEKGVDEEIIVPLTIQNHEKYVMEGITLSAESNRTDIEMEFSEGFIAKLDPQTSEEVFLYIDEQNRSVAFEVKVSANVETPDINDSATISIQINENASGKVEFVRDFIRLNPECLELTEVLEQARKEIQNGDYNKANVLISIALEQCKAILSTKAANLERPGTFSMLNGILKNPYGLYVGTFLISAVLLTLGFLFYNRYKWY